MVLLATFIDSDGFLTGFFNGQGRGAGKTGGRYSILGVRQGNIILGATVTGFSVEKQIVGRFISFQSNSCSSVFCHDVEITLFKVLPQVLSLP
jgi:hypothetical protein